MTGIFSMFPHHHGAGSSVSALIDMTLMMANALHASQIEDTKSHPMPVSTSTSFTPPVCHPKLPPKANMVAINLTATLSTLITANHILDYNSVLDGLGHISVRNPLNASTFFMTGKPPPALVARASDLSEYNIDDGAPVSAADARTAEGAFDERFIHQSILKRYPSQNSVVHSHARSVIPFGISDVPFESTYHMTGFMGETVPVFDIADYYFPNETQNMLINSPRLGGQLADMFSTPAHNVTRDNRVPDHTLVLQRGHGFATVATSIEQAVYRAVYTTWNAEVLATATEVQGAGGVEFLTEREAADCVAMNDQGLLKDWPLWVAQTVVDPLYRNDLG